jgi:hypothetical protein
VQASGVFNLAAAGLVERLLAGYVRHLADERATAVTSTAEEYRAKARDCEERAAQMPDSYVQEQFARNSEEVADHGRFRRKARALGRLTWRPRYSAPFRLASPTLAIAANSPRLGTIRRSVAGSECSLAALRRSTRGRLAFPGVLIIGHFFIAALPVEPSRLRRQLVGEFRPLGFHDLAHLVRDDLDHGRVEQSLVQFAGRR